MFLPVAVGQVIAGLASTMREQRRAGGRKVRAPESRVPGNAR